MQDALLKLLKINIPLILSPMANAGTPTLIAAVSNEGGLGSFAGGYMQPESIRKAIREIKQLTDKPFAVNLFVPRKHSATPQQINNAKQIILSCCKELELQELDVNPPYAPNFEEQLQVIIDEKVPVFSFTFGIPEQNYIETLKQRGIVLIGTATTLAEARMLEQNEVDAVVLQGSESGGHRGSFLVSEEEGLIPLEDLIAKVTGQINLPLIAAGGLMNAESVKRAFELGANAVQLGTAFLCCEESGISNEYKQKLLHSKDDSTVLTRAFSGKYARGLKNTFIERMQAHESSILDYPIQNTLTQPMRKKALSIDNMEFFSMWAGTGAHMCQKKKVSELIKLIF